MARQSTTPVAFRQSTRSDSGVLMTSGRAGKVIPCGYIPVLAMDSVSGRVAFDVQLAEMPKPLLNAVQANFQAWFMPRSAMPYFSGRDEVMHAMTEETITALGQADRTPPALAYNMSAPEKVTARASDLMTTLGIHHPSHSANFHADIIDAFVAIYNFRLAAHSSKLPRRQYAQEDIDEATALPRAFWPSSRFSRIVPDYEQALLMGHLDLDVLAGQLPVVGAWAGATSVDGTGTYQPDGTVGTGTNNRRSLYAVDGTGDTWTELYAEMAGQAVGISLADIDKARTTQAFARLRAAYAGAETTGFSNDDTLVAMLMQGIAVPPDQFKRPWLLDQKRVTVGFTERFATDGASLDASVTTGRASAVLSLNVPRQDTGGVIIFTCEVLPERIDERQFDEWLTMWRHSSYPNALRDIQRPEPVDLVLNRRLDAYHTDPSGLYGYEPMNDKWNRSFTRLGGHFYNSTPGGGFTENRSNIWQTEIIDPVYNALHWLAPANFPHDVFSDTEADAFEIVARHVTTIVGNTQIGDVLLEDNSEYEDTDTNS